MFFHSYSSFCFSESLSLLNKLSQNAEYCENFLLAIDLPTGDIILSPVLESLHSNLFRLLRFNLFPLGLINASNAVFLLILISGGCCAFCCLAKFMLARSNGDDSAALRISPLACSILIILGDFAPLTGENGIVSFATVALFPKPMFLLISFTALSPLLSEDM
jgi:hypothetical protein